MCRDSQTNIEWCEEGARAYLGIGWGVHVCDWEGQEVAGETAVAV